MHTLKLYFRNHPRMWLATFLVLPVLIGCLTVFSAKSWGDTSDKRMCSFHTNPDNTCAWSPHKTAKKFRQHYYKRAHGINFSNYFEHPAKSRAIFVRKTHRKIAHMSPARRRLVLQTINSAAARTARGAGNPPTVCEISDWWCMARASVFTTIRGANCRGGQFYSTLMTTCVDKAPAQHFMTVKQTIAVGGVFFCGGAVVIGTLTSTASAGTTVFIAGWGATSCLFSTWAAAQ